MNCEGIYILVAERPYIAQTGKRVKKAGRYVGWAKNINDRIREHRKKEGARLIQIWIENDIEFTCKIIIVGADRKEEKKIKATGHYERFFIERKKKWN